MRAEFVLGVLVVGAVWFYRTLGESVRRDTGSDVSNWVASRAMLRVLFAGLTKGEAAADSAGKAVMDEFRNGAGNLANPPQSGRAFAGQIGRWPKVTHAGDGGYLIEASFSSPRRARWPTWLGAATAVVLFFWLLGNLRTVWPGSRDTESLRIVAVLIGSMIAGAASRIIWMLVCRVHLKIKVQQGGATWIGPGGKRCRIQPNEPYQPGWTPHRLAAQAQRKVQDRLRRGKIPQNTKIKPTYEEASEVVFRTGAPHWHIEQPVAEIAGDVTGRRALALQVALDVAIETNRKTMEAAEAQRRAAASGMGGLDRE